MASLTHMFRMRCIRRILLAILLLSLFTFGSMSYFSKTFLNTEIRRLSGLFYTLDIAITAKGTGGIPSSVFNTTTMSHSTTIPHETTIPYATDIPYGIDQHNYSYIIPEMDICKDKNGSSVYLVITVCIAPGNKLHREVIRETWGSIGRIDPGIRIVFLLGNPQNVTLQNQLYTESMEYGDIIQEDFVDSYRNLSIKSVAMLKWVSQFCNSAKYVLKVDDDVYVNVDYLINVLKNTSLSNSVFGYKIHGSIPVRSRKSRWARWYTPPELYKGKVYPDYCAGSAYVLSVDIVPKLFEVSKKTPLLWIEDVFITGICRRAIGAKVVNNLGFTYTKLNPDGCSFRKRISGNAKIEKIPKIWKEMIDPTLNCTM